MFEKFLISHYKSKAKKAFEKRLYAEAAYWYEKTYTNTDSIEDKVKIALCIDLDLQSAKQKIFYYEEKCDYVHAIMYARELLQMTGSEYLDIFENDLIKSFIYKECKLKDHEDFALKAIKKYQELLGQEDQRY